VFASPLLLLEVGEVQKELKLTNRQIADIRTINQKFDRERLESVRKASGADGKVNPDTLMAIITGLRRENEAALARVLEPGQRRRVSEIALQVEGPTALARPELASRLNLGPDQVEQIQAIVSEMSAWKAQLVDSPPGGSGATPTGGPAESAAQRAADRRKAQDARVDRLTDALGGVEDRAAQQVLRVLTRRQRAAYQKMLGEPFDLSRLASGRGAGAGAPPAGAVLNLTPASAETQPGRALPDENAPVVLEPIPAGDPPAAKPPR
jgi:hypothetical protein